MSQNDEHDKLSDVQPIHAGKGDNRIVVIAQIGLIYGLVVFSCVCLALRRNDQIYVYILSTCIGLLFPQPKIRKNGK